MKPLKYPAQAFPNSDFVGYDISRYALDRAKARYTRVVSHSSLRFF